MLRRLSVYVADLTSNNNVEVTGRCLRNEMFYIIGLNIVIVVNDRYVFAPGYKQRSFTRTSQSKVDFIGYGTHEIGVFACVVPYPRIFYTPVGATVADIHDLIVIKRLVE